MGGLSPAAFYFWTSYGRRSDYKEEGCQLVLHVSGREGGTGGDQSCTLSCIVSCQGIFVLILACFGVSTVLQENMGRCFIWKSRLG